MNRNDFASWYNSKIELYRAYTNVIENLVITLLQTSNVFYHSVSGRVKAESSFIEKTTRKEYSSPEQMTDISGVRIITYTTAEISKVCSIIENEFDVDIENSGDKLENLDADQVGYLSIHYVVKLKKSRTTLAEYKPYTGLYCEVQIRSLLQHAWAEIEHDKNYKFSGVLPKEMRRRFYLIAGTLELMDKEFSHLTEDIDDYAETVQKRAEMGDLNIPIDSTSLIKFLNQLFKDYDTESLTKNYTRTSEKIIQELQDFGIDTIQQLNDLLIIKPVGEWVNAEQDCTPTYVGIIRDAMIFSNPEQYFTNSWKEHWMFVSRETLNYWKKNGFDPHRVETIIKITPDEDLSGDYLMQYAMK